MQPSLASNASKLSMYHMGTANTGDKADMMTYKFLSDYQKPFTTFQALATP